jgi:hypothetical protein
MIYEYLVCSNLSYKLFCKLGSFLLGLCRHITEFDLLRFMNEEEVSRTLPLFDGAMETGKITPRVLKSWVVCFSTQTAEKLSFLPLGISSFVPQLVM